MHYLALAVVLLVGACAPSPRPVPLPGRLPVGWEEGHGFRGRLYTYLTMRHRLTGEPLSVELCPAVSQLVDATAMGASVRAGQLPVRSIASIDEARCSGTSSRADAEDLLVIRSIRFTGDSFVVTAERRRLSRWPFSWRERWIELAVETVPFGRLVADGWSTAH